MKDFLLLLVKDTNFTIVKQVKAPTKYIVDRR